MQTRRQFVKAVASGIAVTELHAHHSTQQSEKKVRIGIIGAENSHTIGYGEIFNRDRKFPGFELVGVWGETPEFAKNAANKGQIPWIVKDPAEFMGRIDALIVDHRHPRYHLEAAWPFVEAGIPTFIDKPFCYRVSEGKKFLEMARSKRTPITSFSTTARGEEIDDLKAQAAALKGVQHIISSGHCDADSPYGGVFFYGVHQIQRLIVIFGEDISRVRVSRQGKDASAILDFASGRQATVILSSGRPPFELGVITNDGLQKLQPRVKDDPMTPYREVTQLFREGKEVRSHESLLRETAILEALERSVASDRWEPVTI